MRAITITMTAATLAAVALSPAVAAIRVYRNNTGGVPATASGIAGTGTYAQCIPSTVSFTQVVTETAVSTSTLTTTFTTTEFVPVSDVGPVSAAGETSTGSYTTWSTSTVQYTRTVVVTPPAPPASTPSSSAGPLHFMTTDGTTLWLGSAPSSGVSIVFVTSATTVYVSPHESIATQQTPTEQVTDADMTTRIGITSTSTILRTVTVTPSISEPNSNLISTMPTLTIPAYTLTHFSFETPDTTSTVTSTHYTTITLSQVTRTPTSSQRSSFAGINSAGWNMSASTNGFEHPVQPTTTTLAEIIYQGTNSTTTLTSTVFLTTTIGATVTQTLTRPASISLVSGSLTTVVPPPRTITFVVGTGGVSTSIARGTGSSSQDVSGTSPSFSGSTGSTSLADIATTAITSGSLTQLPLLSTSPAYGTLSSTVPNEPFSQTVTTVTSFVNGQGTTFTSAIQAGGASSSSVSGASSDSNSDVSQTSSTTQSIASSTLSSFTSSLLDSATQEISGSSPASTTSLATSSILSMTRASNTSIPGSRTPPAYSQSPVSGSSSSESRTVDSSSGQDRSTSPSSRTGSAESSTTAGVAPSTMSDAAISSPSSASLSGSTSSSDARQTSSIRSTSLGSAFPTGCGQQNKFIMTFDDLPSFSPSRAMMGKRQLPWSNSTNPSSNGTTDITQYPPISNTRSYKHMWFSEGYVYAPDSVEPYSPVSPPNVAAFVEPMRAGSRPPNSGNEDPGEMGTGPNEDDTTFWFDPLSAYIGCDNRGPSDCTMQTTGYIWDSTTQDEKALFVQNYTIPPCLIENCTLHQIFFPPNFRGLSGLQFQALVGNRPRMFFVDDMAMDWSNKSCAAGQARSREQTAGCTQQSC